MTKAVTPSELQIQSSVRAQLRYVAPAVVMVAIPNAAKRGPAAARQAKREGMQAGFPDCAFYWPGGGHCLVEFKSARGTVSENQRDWHVLLTDYGQRVAVCRSVEEAFAFLIACGAPVRVF